MKERIKYIKNIVDLDKDDFLCIDTCLNVFRLISNNENRLSNMINYLIKIEGFPMEMAGIYVGREIDGIDEQFINTMGTNNIIALRYDDEYIVMPEKLGIKIITDWCAENATNPEIPTLCEQLKQKYEVE